VSGNVTLLLSGGIDSPVAGWLCQKRGCRLNAVYFHAFPYTGDGSRLKVLELARHLGRAQGGHPRERDPVRRVPGGVPRVGAPALPGRALPARDGAPGRARRGREDAAAIATGENLGQVASQTIPNLLRSSRRSTCPCCARS
jgi:thiamine biosynthesis protein ThiI